MDLLSMLLGGAGAGAQAAPTSPPPQGAAPLVSTPPLNAVGGGQAQVPADAPPTAVSGITVTGHRNTPQTPTAPTTNYNNMGDVNAIHNIAQQYGDNAPGQSTAPTPHTLRNMLGALGDAFLVQAGHQPQWLQQQQRNQVANAAAGFQEDPGAAAARIAATGMPGSMETATGLEQQAQNNELRKATMENTQAYRQDVMSDREQNHQAQQAIQQGKADDRARSLFGGRLAAVANDPVKYAATRAAIVSQIGKMPGTSIDPEVEFPSDPSQFNAGYGLNANQYGRQQISTQSIAERANAASQASQDRRRGQNMAAGSQAARTQAILHGQATTMPGQMQGLIQKQNQGIPLTPAEQQVWARNTHISNGAAGLVLPPGLRPGGAAAAPTRGPQLGGAAHGPTFARVPPGAAQYLKSNPGLRSAFDAKYGAGASAQILGH